MSKKVKGHDSLLHLQKIDFFLFFWDRQMSELNIPCNIQCLKKFLGGKNGLFLAYCHRLRNPRTTDSYLFDARIACATKLPFPATDQKIKIKIQGSPRSRLQCWCTLGIKMENFEEGHYRTSGKGLATINNPEGWLLCPYDPKW